jgi:dolichol-phosphate mannosyltransferase
MPLKTLIFIPTYNERDNVGNMCRQIHDLRLDADLLITDDNSPDGTGTVLDEMKPNFPRLLVHHRSGKLGIGSAHSTAIQWAYDQGYERLVTMDCDFTHSPGDIPKMLAAVEGFDVAVGSRFMEKESLPGWSAARKLLTAGGHFLTRTLLGMPFDASGAFRVYDLEKIPREVFRLVEPAGYAFFFESLFILARNGFAINEIPIVLPSRVSGQSKMSLKEVIRGVSRLFSVSIRAAVRPWRFKLAQGNRGPCQPARRGGRALP